MIIKFAGGILVLAGGFLMGYRIAYSMKRRMQELMELKRMLLFLKGEIEYNMMPLNMAFQNVSEKLKEPFALWLSSVSVRLEDRNGNKFMEIWEESLRELSARSFLKQKDIRLLQDLGQSLGYLDIKQQLGGISLCNSVLESEIVQARDALPGKIKTVISMSILGGIMIVLTLL